MKTMTWLFPSSTLTLTLSLLGGGCSSCPSCITVNHSACTRLPCYDADYNKTACNAITALFHSARPTTLGADAFDAKRPLLIATTVDLGNYALTSNFGRIWAENLQSAVTTHWKNPVIKMTVRQGTTPILDTVPLAGEYILSRDVRELAIDFNAGSVLTSTYQVAIDKVYIVVNLINVDQNAVVASCQFAIPLGPRTEALLANKGTPRDAESILSYRTPLPFSGHH